MEDLSLSGILGIPKCQFFFPKVWNHGINSGIVESNSGIVESNSGITESNSGIREKSIFYIFQNCKSVQKHVNTRQKHVNTVFLHFLFLVFERQRPAGRIFFLKFYRIIIIFLLFFFFFFIKIPFDFDLFILMEIS
jgi:hypothetical protein